MDRPDRDGEADLDDLPSLWSLGPGAQSPGGAPLLDDAALDRLVAVLPGLAGDPGSSRGDPVSAPEQAEAAGGGYLSRALPDRAASPGAWARAPRTRRRTAGAVVLAVVLVYLSVTAFAVVATAVSPMRAEPVVVGPPACPMFWAGDAADAPRASGASGSCFFVG